MKTIRVKKFKEHRCADLIGSLRNKVKVRGDIVTTSPRTVSAGLKAAK